MIVAYLPDHQKHPLWNEIHRLIALGTAEGIEPVEEKDFVWIAFEGTILFAAGTVVMDGDTAHLLAVGGFEHRRWIKEALDTAIRWARSAGAKQIVMEGRKGWARCFRALGWSVSGTHYEKVL